MNRGHAKREEAADNFAASILEPLFPVRPADGSWPADRELGALSRQFAYVDVWSRPGLPAATRSLMTIAILTALRCTD